jgi:HlyD family secretion protein
LESVESRYESAKANFAMAQERANRIAADQAAELRSAETRVEQAKAELASAQKAWDTLDAGQSAELKSAQARVAQAQAELASAQERWRTIAQDQAAERESARAKVAQAKAALEHARADAVQRQVRQAEVASANAQVDRVQAQVKSAQTTLGYTTVRAPRDGVILQRYVEEGTIVTSGSRGVMEGMNIVELGDLTKMFVDVDVDESDLADVRLGQSVEIQVDACGGDVFRGTVTRIDPQAVTTQNVTTVPVEVEVQGHDARLMPGLTATCDFVVAEAEDTLHLPSRVVRSSGDGYVVTGSCKWLSRSACRATSGPRYSRASRRATKSLFPSLADPEAGSRIGARRWVGGWAAPVGS